MFVHAHPSPGVLGILFDAKHPRTLLVKHACIHQVINPRPWFERRIELNQRLRPQHSLCEPLLDERPDSLVTNLDEAPNVVGVLGD